MSLATWKALYYPEGPKKRQSAALSRPLNIHSRSGAD